MIGGSAMDAAPTAKIYTPTAGSPWSNAKWKRIMEIPTSKACFNDKPSVIVALRDEPIVSSFMNSFGRFISFIGGITRVTSSFHRALRIRTANVRESDLAL